jgi:hypothetical protein
LYPHTPADTGHEYRVLGPIGELRAVFLCPQVKVIRNAAVSGGGWRYGSLDIQAPITGRALF